MSTPDLDQAVEIRKSRIDTLDADHRDPILQAISNILSTEIAEVTYAQVVDGLPLASAVNDAYYLTENDHPVLGHKELCPGVLEQTRSFRAAFNPTALLFDAGLLLAYHAASPGSRAFKTRFIEIIAVAIHQIAVLLFKQDTSRHKDGGIVSWIPPEEPDHDWWFTLHPDGPLPSLFAHSWFTNFAHYPEGVADMVGYWAEARILGGVVTFDRQSPESDDVYFHPDRSHVTYRICLLLDSQKQDLLSFLLSESVDPSAPVPIPIRPGRENDKRVDSEESIALTGIYRDIWERKTRPDEFGDERAFNYNESNLNFTSMRDWAEARNRWRTRWQRYNNED
ncbi:hypothetical protein B0H63DRAFT_218904 [Podospora didyma]|uniref:Uncharacterized protein n=1 Tax=Podospora didyma TaxID=330526 RepID=A0AAE0KKB5_9PEZI|nr:hypothetical protein B0H63DRAFT_218904 [Podospora didyma]